MVFNSPVWFNGWIAAEPIGFTGNQESPTAPECYGRQVPIKLMVILIDYSSPSADIPMIQSLIVVSYWMPGSPQSRTSPSSSTTGSV
jgi:hypothetical protein